MKRSGRNLDELVSELKMYPQKMVNVPLLPGVHWQTNVGLQEAKEKVERQLNGRGRVLIRGSGTEAKLRLMVEADEGAGADSGGGKLLAVDLHKVERTFQRGLTRGKLLK